MSLSTRSTDVEWDSIVSDYRFSDYPSYSFKGRLDALLDLLDKSSVEQIYKRQYAVLYLLLGIGAEGAVLEEAARNHSDDQEFMTYINDYNTAIADYNEKKGVNEYNRDRYAVYTLNAFVTGDLKFLESARRRFANLEYLDSWPGCLTKLIKRSVLDSSIISMAAVAEWYPEILVHHLRNRLNYRDLAVLLVSKACNPGTCTPSTMLSYDLFRSHVVDLAVKNARDLRDDYLSLVSSAIPDIDPALLYGDPIVLHSTLNELAESDPNLQSVLRGLDLRRNSIIPGYGRMSPLVLLNEGFDPRLILPVDSPLRLSLGDAEIITDLLSLFNPGSASTYNHLIAYLSSTPSFASMRGSNSSVPNDGSMRNQLIRAFTGGRLGSSGLSPLLMRVSPSSSR